MNRPKMKKDVKNKGIRVRMTEKDMKKLEYLRKIYPIFSKSEIIRQLINEDYEKHSPKKDIQK